MKLQVDSVWQYRAFREYQSATMSRKRRRMSSSSSSSESDSDESWSCSGESKSSSEEELCDYEKRRLDNIRRNQQMMRTLGKGATAFILNPYHVFFSKWGRGGGRGRGIPPSCVALPAAPGHSTGPGCHTYNLHL